MNTAQHLIVCALLAMTNVVNAQELSDQASQETAPEVTQEVSSEDTQESTQETAQQEAQKEVEEVSKGDLKKGSLLKSKISTQEYNKALYYDVKDVGLVLPPLELEYDLATSNGSELRIGNVKLNEKNFYFGLFPLGKTHPDLPKVLSSSDKNKMTLVMSWPNSLVSNGKIEMISKTGKVLWQHEMTPELKNKWNSRLAGYKKDLVGKGAKEAALKNKGIFAINYGLDVEADKIPLAGQKEQFRFCITQTTGNNNTRLCSQQYGVATRGNGVVMGRAPSEDIAPRVIVGSEEKGLKDTLVVGHEMPVSFFAELKTGQSYEFFVKPLELNLVDIADTGKKDIFRVVGVDNFPVNAYKVIDKHQEKDFIKMIGFESTIYDQRIFWMAAVKVADPKLYLPGQGGGIFKQRIQLENIPARSARAYLRQNTPKGTYSDGIRLRGRKPHQAVVKSDENSVVQSKDDPAMFDWYFKATEKGKLNKSYLTVEYEGKEYKSYYELYKGYASEISGRFTGVQSSSDTIVLGEVALNHWFEDIFGWDQYYLSRQRWGVSAKYFKSLTDLTVSSAGDKEQISVLTVDLKYRLTPGLWARDESFGLLGSYQSVEFGEVTAPMLGVGAFWARSMPKVIDDFFNLLPMMRYPKWVDMEFIYYLNSMDSNVELNSSMSLNFHGKVLWTDTLFGEAGFGIKRYGFKDSSLNQKAELNTFYGTIGLGLNF